jgi:hypothetical protein
MNQLPNLFRESIDKVSAFSRVKLVGTVNIRLVKYATRRFTDAPIFPES